MGEHSTDTMGGVCQSQRVASLFFAGYDQADGQAAFIH